MQAQSCENTLASNIVYNIPRGEAYVEEKEGTPGEDGVARLTIPVTHPASPFLSSRAAAINFVDGFGGANILTDNLLYNTCR